MRKHLQLGSKIMGLRQEGKFSLCCNVYNAYLAKSVLWYVKKYHGDMANVYLYAIKKILIVTLLICTLQNNKIKLKIYRLGHLSKFGRDMSGTIFEL